jgi:hypothetical protein
MQNTENNSTVEAAGNAFAGAQAGFEMNADGTYTPHAANGQASMPVKASVTIADTTTSSAQASAYEVAQSTPKQTDLHALDAGLGHVQLKAAADVLAQRRAVWEAGAFAASNAELIALLADCLGFHLHLIKFDDARKQFHAIYKEAKLTNTKGTELMTKIVRYVFGEKAVKRTFAYAKVLTVASEENVAPETLAAFVAKRGGIEEIRRNGGGATEKRKMRDESIEKASASLKIVKPLAEKVVPPKTLKVEGATNFVAAIIRRETDGTLSIVHLSTNETLIESLLANAAKDFVKSEATSDTEAYVANRQSNANHAGNQ